MKRNYRTPLIYLIILLAIILMAAGVEGFGKEKETLEYGEFLQAVRDGKVQTVRVTMPRELIGLYKDSTITKDQMPGQFDFAATIPDINVFTRDMAIITAELNAAAGVTPAVPEEVTGADYPFEYDPKSPKEVSFLVGMIPYVLLLGGIFLIYYFMMQQQGGGNKVMSFGKSRARVQLDGQNKVTFDDVAGADEEKMELQEVVEFMRDPKRFSDIGARIPKGVLLVGPPGTGKTLLAKAVAGEANVPFFSISGSDFVEMFVGVGASRVRDLFNTAKKSTPAVVFIDEIDAVGRQRGAGMGGGHDEREQTLNQLLVEMDGFAPNEGIIVIAATNRPDILDPALLRPGRFDRQITVNYPDIKGREEILKVHSRNKPLADEVDLSVLAKRTPGFTGADLENVLNEGAILTARAHKRKITMDELEEAITRVVVGPEKRSRVITDKDKKITAYHESGHAIVALKLPNCDPVHEVSIIPRGLAGGYTMTLPKEDMTYVIRAKLLDEIAMLLGGRVAETVRLDDISTGAYNDLQRATDLARKMVVEYGMTDAIGPVFLGGQAEVFIAKDWGHQRNFSEEIASKIDEEIRRILDAQFDRARACIEEDLEALDRVAAALLEEERMDGEDFEALYKGESVDFEGKKKAKQERLEAQQAEARKEEEAQRKERERLDPGFRLDQSSDSDIQLGLKVDREQQRRGGEGDKEEEEKKE